MANRDFNAYRKSQVEKPKSIIDIVNEIITDKMEKPKQYGPVKKTENKTTTKTKNSKNTKSDKSSNTNLIATEPSIPKKGESWGDYLEERKKYVDQKAKNSNVNITKTIPKKGESWSGAVKGKSKKETLVFNDYVPGKNDYTKEQYQWQREVAPSLPEFGSYEYFKRRERELRPIVEEIGANTDRYDETYMPWVREYGEYVEGKRDSWSRQHDPADAAEVKKLYNKIKYEDQILKEYKTVTDYVDKFDEKGVHYNLSGEVDTKSGKEEASYAAQRKQNAADALANTRLIDLTRRSLYDPVSKEKQAEYDSIMHIADKADVEKSKVDAYEYYEKNKDNKYKNDFGGITSGNWFLGRTGIKTNDAGYAAYKAETDDLEAVEVYQLLSNRVQNNNKSTFTNDNGFKKWWSNIAQYAPQGLDQAINTVAGYAMALPMALVSRSAFAKTGNALAAGINAEYMFRQTAGSAFIRQLQENELSVEDAKKLAENEALASAAVELALSWAAGKVFQKAGGSSAVKKPIEKVGNAFTNSLKKIGISDAGVEIITKSIVGTGKVVASSTGEGFEEGLQEGVSIVADRYAKSGEDSSAPGMLLEAFDLSKYSSDDWQRIKEAAEAGFVIGLGSNVGHVAANNGPDAIRGVTNYIGEKRVENAWTDLIKDAQTKVTDTERENAGVIRNEFTEAMDQKVVSDIDDLAKSLGVRVEVTDGVRGGTADASVNGRVIKMDKTATRPYDFLMGHEMTHYMQSVSSDAYNRFKSLAVKRIGDNYINNIYNRYTAKGVENFTYDSAVDEAVADYAGSLISNSKNLDKFIVANRSDKGVLGALKSAVTYLKDKLTGNSKVQAQVAEAKLDNAINGVNLEKENTAQTDGERYSIAIGPKGKYVRADRQVIFGNDPESWREQAENYINGKIRKGEDIQLIAEDGETFTLSSVSASKMTSPYKSDAIKINDNEYETKLNAATHIDELVKVSKHKNQKPDIDGKHGAFAEDGWKYRTAWFQDFDGRYYKLSFSVALNKDGSVIYNIGDIEERSLPTINGSSVKDGALNGEASSTTKLPQSAESVKRDNEYFLAVKRGDIATVQKIVNETAKEAGYPIEAYHGTPNNDFTKFDKNRVGKGTDQYGAGFYFASNKDAASSYGARVIDSRLAINKPFEVDGSRAANLIDAGYDHLLTEEQAYEVIKRLPDIYDEEESPLGDYYDSYWETGPQEWMIKDLAANESYRNIGYLDSDLFRKYPNELHEALRDVVGYDGVEVRFDNGDKFYVAWFDNQMKSADPITYDDNGNIIPPSERFNPEKDDIRFSLKDDFSVDERLAMMRDKYGTMRKGEKPYRTVVVPKKTAKNKHVAQTVRTILEAKVTPEVKVPPLKALIAKGEFSFDRYTDKAAIADAEAIIKDKGWNVALADWINDSKRGKISKENVALGWLLYNNAANSGDAKTAIDIFDYVIGNQRNAAQAVQATRILKTLSPETQLYQVQRSVVHLQESLNKKYNKKGAPELKINTELAEQFLKAETQEARDDILKDIYRDIGRQMPNTFMDKWRAWRYLAMLGNPRTHVRNFLGNAVFAPVVSTKNVIATLIESAASKFSGGKFKRTKAYGMGVGELKKAAQADYDKVSDVISGDAKYGDSLNSNKYIREGQVVFKSNIPVLKQLNQLLEAARKGNTKLLEKGDEFFSKPRYVSALAHYCKANGITAEQIAQGGKAVDQARAYAILEAQKATFKDINALSNFLSKRLREDGDFPKTAAGLNTLIEGILPFRKTPANILARAVEYSPVGLATTLTKGISDVRKGNITGAEFIDKLSAGITGTGIAVLGWSLASMGLIRGHGSAEEKENDFEELMGHQAYSLELPGGVSVTLDWLAPEAIPFFLGVNLYEATQETEDEPLSVSMVFDVLRRTSEPMLEMSCLQGLNDVFESVGYAASSGNDALSTILITAASSIIQQTVPTLGGQIERTFEDERMTTFTEKNPNVPKDLQYLLGKLSQKLPVGWDYKQIPYIDAWGRTEKTGEPAMRAFNNLLNPAYVSEINESDMEKELKRLYNATGENGVLPSRAKQEFTVEGETVSLDAEEYQKYATKRGEVAYDMMTEVTKSYAYAELSDEKKAKVVEAVFDYATQVAKSDVSTFETEKWVKSFDEAQELGISAIDFIMENKLDPKKVEDAYELLSDKDKKLVKSTKADESGADLKRILLMRRTDLTPEQKALLDKTCISERKNPIDYTSEETFYYSQLTEAKQKRYPEVKKRWNIDVKTYYRIIDACSGLTKKADKIQALRKIGFGESDAYRFYNVVFKN